jgi:hypothetical protein
MHIALYKKGDYPSEQVINFLAYTFEKFYKFNSDHQILIILNLSNAGLRNIVKNW